MVCPFRLLNCINCWPRTLVTAKVPSWLIGNWRSTLKTPSLGFGYTLKIGFMLNSVTLVQPGTWQWSMTWLLNLASDSFGSGTKHTSTRTMETIGNLTWRDVTSAAWQPVWDLTWQALRVNEYDIRQALIGSQWQSASITDTVHIRRALKESLPPSPQLIFQSLPGATCKKSLSHYTVARWGRVQVPNR